MKNNTVKTILFFIFPLTAVAGCTGCQTGVNTAEEHPVIYRIHNKTGLQDTDTQWVSQNDTLVFKAEEGIQGNPGQRPKLVTYYELKDPKDGAYYFIYDTRGKLIQEGKYSARYVYEGQPVEHGNFYNAKRYYYKDNGTLSSIHYQADGRNFKTELYNRKRVLTEVIYFNKKSGDKEKAEIYKNGKLKETRIYTGFNRYFTQEAIEGAE